MTKEQYLDEVVKGFKAKLAKLQKDKDAFWDANADKLAESVITCYKEAYASTRERIGEFTYRFEATEHPSAPKLRSNVTPSKFWVITPSQIEISVNLFAKNADKRKLASELYEILKNQTGDITIFRVNVGESSVIFDITPLITNFELDNYVSEVIYGAVGSASNQYKILPAGLGTKVVFEKVEE